jgi:hypothetical protein
MQLILTPPFATRVYPSPRTGQEITVHATEIPMTDSPDAFVARRFDAATDLGHHLLATDIRGSRPWTSREIEQCVEEFGQSPREHPWVEVWEIMTRNQLAVLDLIMFTNFYSDQTMKRFEEFADLTLPMIENYGAFFRQANLIGVEVDISRAGDVDRASAAGTALKFNMKPFTMEQSRTALLRKWSASGRILFGHC